MDDISAIFFLLSFLLAKKKKADSMNQSYEIKSPPWTILWLILGIFYVENIDRLGVFMF